MSDNFSHIINQYKVDKESVYNTWYINNEERLNAFRSIRRGVLQVVEDIKNKTFPNYSKAHLWNLFYRKKNTVYNYKINKSK